MRTVLERVALLALLIPMLSACHIYYLASADVPLAAPLDTACMRSRLTDGGPHGPLQSRQFAEGRTTTVAYSTPAMFRSRWDIVAHVARRDSGVHRGTVYRDSSAVLGSTYIQVNRRIEAGVVTLLTADMARLLFDLRDACGGKSPDGAPLYMLEVRETPYRAWIVRQTNGRVRARLTVDSREYRMIHFVRNPGRFVLRVDTLASDADPRHPRWLEVDTLTLPSILKQTTFATECWRDTMPVDGTVVALARETRSRYLVDILDAWVINRTSLAIDNVAIDGVECLNSGWGSVLLDAPKDLRAAALTFRPSPGRARIYAYLSYPSFPSDSPFPQVVIDSQVVGTLEGGAFLMVELEPGRHRVSSPGRKESVVWLDMAADSSYFVEVGEKSSWSWSGWRATVRSMDPVAARGAIRRAQMVFSSWPGRPLGSNR